MTTTPDFRKTVPQPLSPVEFIVPRFHRTTLDNGLKIVVVPDSRLPLVSFRLAFSWGDVNDPEGLTGVSSAIASMLNEGTFEYSSRQLADQIERLGASISVNASDDFTVLSASSLSLYSSEIGVGFSTVGAMPTILTWRRRQASSRLLLP